jgi:hypothetical protein
LFLIYVFAGYRLLLAQTSRDAGALKQLKSIVKSQQRLPEQQQAQIQALQSALYLLPERVAEYAHLRALGFGITPSTSTVSTCHSRNLFRMFLSKGAGSAGLQKLLPVEAAE